MGTGRLYLVLLCLGCGAIDISPRGVVDAGAREAARRLLVPLAEPGGRIPRGRAWLLRVGRWEISSGFGVRSTHDTGSAAGSGQENASSRLRGRFDLKEAYFEVQIKW